jgi:hypothetical protein
MSWSLQDWGSIGELIGGFAVLVTLGYLALQVRESNRLARLESQARVLEMNNRAMELRIDPDASKLFLTGLADPDRLMPEERHSFYMMLYLQVNGAQLIQLNSRINPYVEEFAAGAETINVIRELAKHRGFQHWWREARHNYGPTMNDEVGRAMRQQQT